MTLITKTFLLPKYYLESVFPHLFAPFWSNKNFMIGALLPLAVLSCFGLVALLRFLPTRRRIAIIALSGVVAFENYWRPQPHVIPAEQFDFIAWLAREDEQDAIRLINLPIDAQMSKVYDFYQIFNGYPHIEGRPTRAPPQAYNYIGSNLLLAFWQSDARLRCLAPYHVEYVSNLDRLINDGFTHIVWHHHFNEDPQFLENFDGAPIAYQDAYVCHRFAWLDLRESLPPCFIAAVVRNASAGELGAFSRRDPFPGTSGANHSARRNGAPATKRK